MVAEPIEEQTLTNTIYYLVCSWVAKSVHAVKPLLIDQVRLVDHHLSIEPV